MVSGRLREALVGWEFGAVGVAVAVGRIHGNSGVTKAEKLAETIGMIDTEAQTAECVSELYYSWHPTDWLMLRSFPWLGRRTFGECPMSPYVICHMVTSIDGRILSQRWGKLHRGVTGARLFETTAKRFGIPAWLIGTTTLREFASKDFALKPAVEEIERTDYIADTKTKRFGIGADAKGVLRFKKGEIGGDHVVLLVTELASNDYLGHLRAAGVSYLFCGRDRVDLRLALRKIGAKLGVKKLLLEGGGTFNGAMLQLGLVDEVSQVIVPVVDGGKGVPGLFDIPGPLPNRAAATLQPIKHERLAGGVYWHRYRVVGKRSMRSSK